MTEKDETDRITFSTEMQMQITGMEHHITRSHDCDDLTTRLDGYRGVDKYTGILRRGEICGKSAINRYGNTVDLVYLVIGSCIHRAKASTVGMFLILVSCDVYREPF
jgi:hypothetical protein